MRKLERAASYGGLARIRGCIEYQLPQTTPSESQEGDQAVSATTGAAGGAEVLAAD